MQKFMLSFLLVALASVASANDSPKDVQAMIARGDYPAAETALREAVSEHPKSAKAHYVLAEVLAHEGNIGEAKAEAGKAAALDPQTTFTDPAKFQAFRQKLDAALAPASARPSSSLRNVDAPQAAVGAPREAGSSHLTGWLVFGAVVALVIFLWSRRRSASNGPQGYGAPQGYGSVPPMNNPPPYGGAPGYPGYAPPPSSGIGSTIAAGVGGLAAGALLDEALRGHREGGGDVTRDVGSTGFVQPDPSGQAYNDLRDEPIDMGNNDSSWDDAGSSDDSGSFDDNSW